MSGISKATGDNYGGISRLYYALMRDITDLFDFEYEQDDLSISQANLDGRFYRLHHLLRSANYDYNRQQGPDGETFDHVIEAAFLKSRQEVRDHIQATNSAKLCLIFKNNNGDWFILPNAEESTSFRSGKEPQNRNGYTMNWSAKLPDGELPLTIT